MNIKYVHIYSVLVRKEVRLARHVFPPPFVAQLSVISGRHDTIHTMKPRLTQLKNGLSVVLVPMSGSESLTAMALVNTGSRFEPVGKEGIAHFFEHIVFKGTSRYPTAQRLAATVDGLGADFNAFTSQEYTGYYVKAAARHARKALDVVSDLLLSPLIRPADIEREKGVIVEEINMYHDQPARHLSNLFGQLVYQGSGLGHDIIGTKETVSALSEDDFRAFLSQWYGLPNVVLALAGKAQVVDDPRTLEFVEELFSKDGGQRPATRQEIKPFLSDKTLAKRRLHLEFRDTQQAHFILAWPGIHRTHPDKYALSVLSTLIGGTMSSRLFTEVREKRGLSYYVYSTNHQFHDKGIVGLAAGVDPARIKEAIQVSAGEFHKLASGRKKVTKTELKRAQEYLVGKWALDMEDSDAVAQFAGLRQLLLGETVGVQEIMQKIQAVTLEEVQDLATRLVQPGEARLALIGPYQDAEVFSTALDRL